MPQFAEVAANLDSVPDKACPGDLGVARLTLNPSYIARSFFPTAMLRSTSLYSVGSRAVKLTPEGWSRKGPPRELATTELFVVGQRQAFRQLKDWGFYPEITDGCERAANFWSCLATLRRILELWSRSMYSNTSALAASIDG